VTEGAAPALATHHVVLCADDFGLTEGVSRGILELARMGRISATSALTNAPSWPRMAPELASLRGSIAVGLHLNLTLGAPLGPMPRLAPHGLFPTNGALIASALAGRLAPDEVSAEIERQLDAFEAALGGPPDFVDGHQHAHVLPGIRGALLEVLGRRGPRLWLRDPSDRAVAILQRGIAASKALTVGALAYGFEGAARRAGFETNAGFSGFSPFDPSLAAERLFERALTELGPRPLVMCHPGHVDAELRARDPVVETRAQEQRYLASDRFPALLRGRGLELATAPA
jgi:chitin disaccharide deacetylase